MSKSSYNLFSINSNKAKDIQGGEKKVMKKSLSVILSTAMALSVFSSVAFADTAAATKTSDNFTDLKDLDAATKAKFDAMISAGIFDGVSDTEFGLKDEMNRAQFAKVAALIMGLDVNKDLKDSSFSDVSADDAANGYALPYIEALKSAGVTDGYGEGTYNPAGKVTKEQLATFLVRVLGKDADAKAKTGDDTTVSDWAQGYVALALELKLFPAAEGGFDGQSNATRDLLLTGAYEAKQQYVPAGKVSVTGAKAAGVQKVEVSFNKPVDTEKAKISLKRGTVDVATTTTWSDDKKTATLTLTDVKIQEADYSVAVTGLDEASVEKTTAEFKGEKEAVKSLEFVNAGDTVAYSKKATVKVKAVNQYGETASFSAGDFSVYTTDSAATITKDSTDGTLIIKMDTKSDNSLIQGASMIPVTVYHNDTRISAQKTFKLGNQPFISKIELGDVKYNNGTGLSDKGDYLEIPVREYDQYGNTVTADQLTADSINDNLNAIVTPYEDNIDVTYDDDSEGNNRIVKLTLSDKIDKNGEYTVTVYGGSSSQTTKFNVKAAAVVTKLEFGTFTGSLAAGDGKDGTDAQYIPLIGYDASGNKLSVSDLTDDTNLKRIKISASGNVTLGDGDASIAGDQLIKTGEHAGSIKIAAVDETAENGTAYISANISEVNANDYKYINVPIGKPRVADNLTVATDSKKKGVGESDTDLILKVKDQYGADLKKIVNGHTTENGKSVTYDVYLTITPTVQANLGTVADPELQNGFLLVGKDDNAAFTSAAILGDATNKQTFTIASNDFDNFNDGFNLKTKSTIGKAEIKFELRKKIDGGTPSVIKTITKNFEGLNAKTADLTYSVSDLGATYAFLDNHSNFGNLDDLIATTYAGFKVAKEVTVSAKDSSGDDVAIPNRIQRVTTGDPNVAQATEGKTVGATTYGDIGKGYVLGNKAGTTDVTVLYKTLKDELKSVNTKITVKNEVPSVASIDGKSDKDGVTTNGTTPISIDSLMDLTVKDQYGSEYKDGNQVTYNDILNLTYAVEDVVGSGTVTVDQENGTVTIPTTVQGFTLKVVAPNGKSLSTAVTVGTN
ncbi:S-layer homology domain-containing protein [Paenibacillus hexagrammi]|uniref:S-layer homology domain-containing protein n=1 Tax=Paenibacillus hexagrammi TaxID=2908839 RepID=A0ABY3SH98_9BACL|nr:S-layer homology domain-containing protein [Paenibacillus sp. YPD9-1]UJF33242.1 S-layer homology domain-containing protein [Paenibacillus sp. YPD9-1]